MSTFERLLKRVKSSSADMVLEIIVMFSLDWRTSYMPDTNGKIVILSLQGQSSHLSERYILTVQDIEPDTQSSVRSTTTFGVYAPYPSITLFVIHACTRSSRSGSNGSYDLVCCGIVVLLGEALGGSQAVFQVCSPARMNCTKWLMWSVKPI
jgi:hypothetical protein